jgi:hypothetical protein
MIGGKKYMITKLKTDVAGNEDSRTIKRTTKGESADLQLKFVRNSKDEAELVHVHCQKDKSNIESLYIISKSDPSFLVTCKICGRAWNSGG